MYFGPDFWANLINYTLSFDDFLDDIQILITMYYWKFQDALFKFIKNKCILYHVLLNKLLYFMF